ncbi:MAG: tetratricopeptide repeat protein [Gammaproteobacteria bacterium]
MDITRDLVKTLKDIYMDDNDTTKMIAELTPLAEGGNASAQHALGLVYYLGIAEDTEFKEATKWLKMSASQGNIDSQHYLGLIFIQSDNYEEAYIWTSLAAENGSAEAQLNLAVMFFNGSGTDKDIDKAIKWATLAAEQGDAQAQCNLAKMYLSLEDETVYQDAIKWFKLSSEQDNAEAQCKLALMYENGQGTEKDYDEAFSLYSLSANQGYADAQYFLGQLYENGLGVEQNLREAYRLYVLAAEQGDEEAKERIIAIETSDPDIIGDASKIIPEINAEEFAIDLIRDGAEKGMSQSQFLLGVAYLTGKSMDIDHERALDLFTKSAAQNNPKAQYMLGVVYEKGIGVEQDINEAYQWYKKSALQGNDDAIEAINQLIESGYELGDDEFCEVDIDGHGNQQRYKDNSDAGQDDYDEDEASGDDEEEEDFDLSDHDEFFMYQEELQLDPSNLRLRYKFLQHLMEMVNSHYSDDRDNMLDLYLSELEVNLNYIINKATLKDKLMNFLRINCLMQLGTLHVLRGNFYEAVKSYYKVIEFKWLYNRKSITLTDHAAPEELRDIYNYAVYNIHSIATRLGIGWNTARLYSIVNDAIEERVGLSVKFLEQSKDESDNISQSVRTRRIEECNALLSPGKAIETFYFSDIWELAEIYIEDPDGSEYDVFNSWHGTLLIEEDIAQGRFATIHNPPYLEDQISRLKIFL